MGYYESLPAYKKSLELTVYIESIVRGFERYHKYTTGADLRNLSRRITILIAKANTISARQEALVEALDKIEELKITIRICREIKAFRKFHNYEYAIKLTISVAKQCEGGLRSLNSPGRRP